ncbi:unnamed protein product [Protopolystoma xenopodis]|uniref:Uncharacterized protein n=1 Tax=Protopolystoma xenopodis TaxID=117903 RepID=A0A448WQY0_9PLAT|nr:unnamed protein product [Protopolystoma xenopodis]
MDASFTNQLAYNASYSISQGGLDRFSIRSVEKKSSHRARHEAYDKKNGIEDKKFKGLKPTLKREEITKNEEEKAVRQYAETEEKGKEYEERRGKEELAVGEKEEENDYEQGQGQKRKEDEDEEVQTKIKETKIGEAKAGGVQRPSKKKKVMMVLAEGQLDTESTNISQELSEASALILSGQFLKNPLVCEKVVARHQGEANSEIPAWSKHETRSYVSKGQFPPPELVMSML